MRVGPSSATVEAERPWLSSGHLGITAHIRGSARRGEFDHDAKGGELGRELTRTSSRTYS